METGDSVKLTILVSNTFPDWQENYIEFVRELFETQKLSDNNLIKEKVGKDMKRAMPFINQLKIRLNTEDPKIVFNRKLNFNEVDTLKKVVNLIKNSPYSIKVKELQVIAFDNGSDKGQDVLTGENVDIEIKGKVKDAAVPGFPGISLKKVEA